MSTMSAVVGISSRMTSSMDMMRRNHHHHFRFLHFDKRQNKVTSSHHIHTRNHTSMDRSRNTRPIPRGIPQQPPKGPSLMITSKRTREDDGKQINGSSAQPQTSRVDSKGKLKSKTIRDKDPISSSSSHPTKFSSYPSPRTTIQEDRMRTNNSTSDTHHHHHHHQQQQQQQIDDDDDKTLQNPTLSACTKALSNLLERQNQLTLYDSISSSSSSWIHHEEAWKNFNYYYDDTPPSSSTSTTSIDSPQVSSSSTIETRIKLYEDVLQLIQVIQLSKKTGRIRALSGKDIQTLSMIFGKCLDLSCTLLLPSWYSHTTTTTRNILPPIQISQSPYETCIHILQCYREWNLNIPPQYYAMTIRMACQEQKFHQAKNLFLNQIDIDQEGYIPIDTTHLGWDSPLEIGLYSIAMSEVQQQQDDTMTRISKEVAIQATEKVFDAISKMNLVSTRDQEKCMSRIYFVIYIYILFIVMSLFV